ncbi:hypothetical protein [Luteolibacter sp. Populi]|uniref:hypothetical protein n=1 Tax=Luteolibacter sp. Populi TaxID=3230487 RepID=UPI003465F7B0
MGFEKSKGNRKLPLEQHDLRTLALMVFDIVVEAMGLASGATREDIAAGLTPIIRSAESEADRIRILELTDLMLDLLLNEAERRSAFREEVRIPVDGGVYTRIIEFHYLRQVHGPNDEMLHRATVEGVNLYTGTLGLDLEDAQMANAAVLKYQIGRGKYREAVVSAKQAVIITTGYEVKLERALRAAERDITQVDWAGEILSMLQEARDHLRTRLESDGEISSAVTAARDDAEEKDWPHIGQLLHHIQDCQQRNSRLHQRILAANEKWLCEQARQAFRPRAIIALPDLEAQVLRTALGLSSVELSPGQCWELCVGFLGVAVPRLIGPIEFFDMLLAPPRDYERAELPLPEFDAEEIGPSTPWFSEEDHRKVDLRLSEVSEREIKVSELLRASREDGMTVHHRTLLYLKVLHEFGAQADRVMLAGEPFSDDVFSGDDLMLSPLQSLLEEDDDGI